ncbi:MAG TPA: hypothetical protein PKY50_19190 [Candidatus Competibacter sp.]|nr:hypothetical protein [Candidatus Competibacter sp.]
MISIFREGHTDGQQHFLSVALAEQRARLEERVFSLDLALQGLPREAAEQGRPAFGDFVSGGLGNQQLEKIGRAQHLQLRRAGQIAPERGVVGGAGPCVGWSSALATNTVRALSSSKCSSSVLLPEPGGSSSTRAGSGAAASTSRKSLERARLR